MVSTSEHDPHDGDRRRFDRRRAEKPFSGTDRRLEARRSGADRRRDPRD